MALKLGFNPWNIHPALENMMLTFTNIDLDLRIVACFLRKQMSVPYNEIWTLSLGLQLSQMAFTHSQPLSGQFSWLERITTLCHTLQSTQVALHSSTRWKSLVHAPTNRRIWPLWSIIAVKTPTAMIFSARIPLQPPLTLPAPPRQSTKMDQMRETYSTIIHRLTLSKFKLTMRRKLVWWKL